MNFTSYQYFGSSDSIDIDVVFFLEKMPPTIFEATNTVKILSENFSKLIDSHRKVNGNLAVVENGELIEAFKGTTDELNNSLYHTYQNHTQAFANHIYNVVKRDVNLKFLRSSRIILSYLSRTNERELIKKALKGDIDEKYLAFKKLKISGLITNKDTDILKVIAFQIGQSLALYEEIELYTKQEISKKYNLLTPFLYRNPTSELSVLDKYFTLFIDTLAMQKEQMPCKSEYKYPINK